MSEETPQMKQALAQAEKQAMVESGQWAFKDGSPMVQITCAGSELINTGNYSNVTIGPIQVRRFVVDGSDEHLKAEIHRTQALCEAAVAEERQTVQTLLRSNAARQSS